MFRKGCRRWQADKSAAQKIDRLRHAKSRKAGTWKRWTLNLFLLLPPTCSLWSKVTSLQDVKTPRATRLSLPSPPLLFYWTLLLWRLLFYCLLLSLSIAFTALVCLSATFYCLRPALLGDGSRRWWLYSGNRWRDDLIMERRKDTILSPSLLLLSIPNIMNLVSGCSMLRIKHTHDIILVSWSSTQTGTYLKNGPYLPPPPQSPFLSSSVLLLLTFIKEILYIKICFQIFQLFGMFLF